MITYYIYKGDTTITQCFLKLVNIDIREPQSLAIGLYLSNLDSYGGNFSIQDFVENSLIDDFTKHIITIHNLECDVAYVLKTEQELIDKIIDLIIEVKK